MKNNRITLPQYGFMIFLSLLSTLLFIEGEPSMPNLVAVIVPLIINILTVILYKGGAGIFIRSVISVYLLVFCLIVGEKFCEFLYKDLGYGPYWALALLTVFFAYLCSVKGVEALSRASVIISFFVFTALSAVAVLSFFKVEPEFSFSGYSGFILPFMLLFPSAVYVLLYENIIPQKKYTLYVLSAILLFVIAFYYFLPDNKVAVGIFKGADGLLSAILSVSAVYALSGSATSILSGYQHKRITFPILFIAVFGLVTALLYSDNLSHFLRSDAVLISASVSLVLALLCAGVKDLQIMNKNTK